MSRIILCALISASLSGTSVVEAQEIRVATHYGEEYNGNYMSCPNTPRYSSSNITIIALSYSDKERWSCGTTLHLEGPVGSLTGIVQDVCPGCGPRNMIDLSESGITQVCGGLYTCEVKVSAE